MSTRRVFDFAERCIALLACIVGTGCILKEAYAEPLLFGPMCLTLLPATIFVAGWCIAPPLFELCGQPTSAVAQPRLSDEAPPDHRETMLVNEVIPQASYVPRHLIADSGARDIEAMQEVVTPLGCDELKRLCEILPLADQQEIAGWDLSRQRNKD